MEDLGEATFILGIEILRDRKRRAITSLAAAYINTLLERHGHADAYCTATPMEFPTPITLRQPPPTRPTPAPFASTRP